MSDPAAADPPAARIPPPAFLSDPAPAAVLAALPGARAVGGAVRDALAGRPVADVDVAAPYPPDEIAARLAAAGLRVHETGLAHGTVTAVLHGQPVEVTSLRRDVTTDGRHAEVEWTTDWREDAARRDFTVNALSLSAAGDLWDPFGGRADLAAGRVRFVGDPDTRLAEDHLRALRYFRFQARYGTGAPDPAALAAIRRAVPLLARLSVERVWMEIKRLLAAPDPAGAVALMAETGVLPAILPEAGPAPALPALRRLIAAGAPPDPLLRLAALLPPLAPPAAAGLARRLRLSEEEATRLARAEPAGPVDSAPADPHMDDAALRRWLHALGDSRAAEAAAWLAQARDGTDRAALRARVAATPVPVFPLQGRDALALGATPGPELGRLLRAVQAWWVEDGCSAGPEACRSRLASLMRDIHPKALPGG